MASSSNSKALPKTRAPNLEAPFQDGESGPKSPLKTIPKQSTILRAFDSSAVTDSTLFLQVWGPKKDTHPAWCSEMLNTLWKVAMGDTDLPEGWDTEHVWDRLIVLQDLPFLPGKIPTINIWSFGRLDRTFKTVTWRHCFHRVPIKPRGRQLTKEGDTLYSYLKACKLLKDASPVQFARILEPGVRLAQVVGQLAEDDNMAYGLETCEGQKDYDEMLNLMLFGKELYFNI